MLALTVHARPAAASDVDADGASDADTDSDGGVTVTVADTDAAVDPGDAGDPTLVDAAAPIDADADAAVDADLGSAVAIPADGGTGDDGGGGAAGGGGASGGGGAGGGGGGGASADAGVATSDAGRDAGGDAPFVNPSPNYPDDGCSVATLPGSAGASFYRVGLAGLALATLALLLARR